MTYIARVVCGPREKGICEARACFFLSSTLGIDFNPNTGGITDHIANQRWTSIRILSPGFIWGPRTTKVGNNFTKLDEKTRRMSAWQRCLIWGDWLWGRWHAYLAVAATRLRFVVLLARAERKFRLWNNWMTFSRPPSSCNWEIIVVASPPNNSPLAAQLFIQRRPFALIKLDCRPFANRSRWIESSCSHLASKLAGRWRSLWRPRFPV